MASTLTGPALTASRNALNAAMADHPDTQQDSTDSGEIQEVNMESQAENIRTVFSDPSNFNVKVSPRSVQSRVWLDAETSSKC